MKRSQIRAIDKMQMRATEKIDGMSYIEYIGMLKLLRLPTISYRRVRTEMIGGNSTMYMIPRLSHCQNISRFVLQFSCLNMVDLLIIM